MRVGRRGPVLPKGEVHVEGGYSGSRPNTLHLGPQEAVSRGVCLSVKKGPGPETPTTLEMSPSPLTEKGGHGSVGDGAGDESELVSSGRRSHLRPRVSRV